MFFSSLETNTIFLNTFQENFFNFERLHIYADFSCLLQNYFYIKLFYSPLNGESRTTSSRETGTDSRETEGQEKFQFTNILHVTIRKFTLRSVTLNENR